MNITFYQHIFKTYLMIFKKKIMNTYITFET